jgi:spermidine synthase
MSNEHIFWLNEEHDYSGSSIGFRVTKKLHEEKTPFQTIAIYDTTDWGKLMTIDGCMMVSTRDNFFYHEMMSHPALYTHTNPKNVVIIGGGDCGTLREVLRHKNVESAIQVEIDERVTRLAEQYFPELCESNNDPRAQLLFIDGIQWMAEAKPESLDVIIIDSTDPIGPAEGLFNAAFYKTCLQALRPDGIIVQQSESPLAHLPLLTDIRNALTTAGFESLQTICFPQPCYPSGWWSGTLARKRGRLDAFREADVAAKPFATQYYNLDIHRAALAQPEFLKRAFGG